MLLPDKDWNPFCQLWKYEKSDLKRLVLRDKICFIVVTGKVNAHLSASKSPQNNDRFPASALARKFRQGEVIHLFSNNDKIPIDGDGASLVFDNVRLTFTPEKGTVVIGLGTADYKSFIEERPKLSSLAAFMALKMSELVANHAYCEGVSPNKVR
jgi:hypothetical protein